MAQQTETERQSATDETVGDCPHCDGRVETSDGERICIDCSAVIDDQVVDHGPEWRNYGPGDQNGTIARCGGGPRAADRHDRGLSTVIGRGTDHSGRTLSSAKQQKMDRLRLRHSRASVESKRDRNRIDAYMKIRSIAAALDLSKQTRRRACRVFDGAQDDDQLFGRSIESFAAASIYAVCRRDGIAITLEDVAEYAPVDESKLRIAYRAIREATGLKPQLRGAADHIPRITSGVGADRELRRDARELAEAADEAGVTSGGKSPTGVAAACVYVAADDHPQTLTQDEIAEAANTTANTLRHRLEDVNPLVE